jgi:type II secretory pathway pseudopilin PulG
MHLAGQHSASPVEPPITAESGYAMAALLVSLSVMAIMMTVAMPVWKHDMQREREAELIFRGEQYVRAIQLFQRKAGPGVLPPSIDLLVEQRFLRKKYKDPITGDDFLPVMAGQALAIQAGQGAAGQSATPGATATAQPGGGTSAGRPATGAAPIGSPGAGGVGGIIGVMSKSKDKSIRLYNGRSHYNEWQFVYIASTQAPGVAPGATGAPGRPGSAQPPGGVIPGGRGGRGGRGGPGTPDGRGGRGPGGTNPFQQPRRPGPGR